MPPRRGAASSRPASAAAAAASGSRPGSPTYHIVCNSEASLSDGELHVERQAGRVTAWYQQGRGGGGAGSTRDATVVEQGHSSFTVVLHDVDDGSEGRGDDEEDADGEAAAGGRGGRSQGQVSWETNNLYDYLKGLHKAGGVPASEMNRRVTGAQGREELQRVRSGALGKPAVHMCQLVLMQHAARPLEVCPLLCMFRWANRAVTMPWQ